jgi:hypothetical protein
MISLCRLKKTVEGCFNESIFLTEETTLFGNGSWHLDFLKHLLCSENIEEKTDGAICLFRPIDCQYAENWTMKCSFVPVGCKSRLRHAIKRTEKDSCLWFNVMLSERQKCDSNVKI